MSQQQFILEQELNKHQINFLIEAIQHKDSPKILLEKDTGLLKKLLDNLFGDKNTYSSQNKGYFLNEAAKKFITIKEGVYARENRPDAKILKKQENNFKTAIGEIQNYDFKIKDLIDHPAWQDNLLRYRINQNEFENFMNWVFDNFTKDSLETKKHFLMSAAYNAYSSQAKLANIFLDPAESKMLIEKLALTQK